MRPGYAGSILFYDSSCALSQLNATLIRTMFRRSFARVAASILVHFQDRNATWKFGRLPSELIGSKKVESFEIPLERELVLPPAEF